MCKRSIDFVVIEGIKADVQQAEKELKEHFQEFGVNDKVITIDGEKALFIKSNVIDEFYGLLSGIDFQKQCQSKDRISVSLSGTKKNISSVSKKVDCFLEEIISKEFVFQDQSQSFIVCKGVELYEGARDKIKHLERENKCSIVFPESSKCMPTVIDKDLDTVSSNNSDFFKNISKNCKLLIKLGIDITDEQCDIIVSPTDALSKHRTSIETRLNTVYPGILNELAGEIKKNSQSSMKIFQTSAGGNLKCASVLHVMLERWQIFTSASEGIKYLKSCILMKREL